MPPRARKRARLTLATNAARPSLLKPSRLISAPASGMRNMRGFGLPGCASGVTVPTSTKPKPIAPKRVDAAAVLVEPCGQADAVGKASGPRSSPGRRHARLRDSATSGVRWIRASAASVRSCACSGSSPNRKGRASGKGMQRHDGRRFWHRRAYFAAGPRAMADQRIEKDTFGPIDVAADRLWGAQTAALAAPLRHLDRADAARAHPRAGLGQAQRRASSTATSARSTPRRPRRSSPPPTRSSPASTTTSSRSSSGRPARGTQTNMNMNEVLANRACELLGGERGEARLVHPERRRQPRPVVERRLPDGDARRRGRRRSQTRLLPRARSAARRRSRRRPRTFADIVKIGRTHLQDATPLTLGQEFSG